MTEGPASITEAFPPDDDVACFVLTMAWARNDVRYSIEQVGHANSADALEFAFWIRVANSGVAWGKHHPLGDPRLMDQLTLVPNLGHNRG